MNLKALPLFVKIILTISILVFVIFFFIFPGAGLILLTAGYVAGIAFTQLFLDNEK